jgi:hypothetical protein
LAESDKFCNIFLNYPSFRRYFSSRLSAERLIQPLLLHHPVQGPSEFLAKSVGPGALFCSDVGPGSTKGTLGSQVAFLRVQ